MKLTRLLRIASWFGNEEEVGRREKVDSVYRAFVVLYVVLSGDGIGGGARYPKACSYPCQPPLGSLEAGV